MTLSHEKLIEKANDIFENVFYKHLPNISELAKMWPNAMPIWNENRQSLQEILSKFSRDDQWWKDNLGIVSEEATMQFNNWVSQNNITTPYNSIDEKGRLHVPLSVHIEVLPGHTHKVTVIHPVTQEEIIYNYYTPCVTINEYDLNQAEKTPDDITFYRNLEGKVIGKAFPLLENTN
jgi:hypothetical protein